MIKDNMQMIQNLRAEGDLFNYDRYTEMCREANVPIRPIHNYMDGLKFLEIGLAKYPELSWDKAYIQAIQDMQGIEALPEANCCDKEVKPKENIKPFGVKDTIKNLVKSTGAHIRNKLSYVSNEEASIRLGICLKCDKSSEGLKCSLCHCYMGVKATWDIENACRLNKW